MGVMLLKRAAVFIYLISVLIVTVIISFYYINPISRVKVDINNTYKPIEGSTEELYQDIFVSLLDPYIQKAINDYYLKYFKGPPLFAPYSVNILNVERPNGYRTFLFIIKLQVSPYFGPHLVVGTDNITIKVDASGKAQVEKFEHIESFELPPHYQGVVKKWPPE